MKLTKKQKDELKNTWIVYGRENLRVLRDGTLEARTGKGHCWGVIYHPRNTIEHLKAVGLM